ncbi:MAG: hypothetical protein OXT67_12425 [Zetaproteobacteria bacterium]|nr:hypothetical protein [Zetaproteobacteria bacterium]
MSYEGRQSFFLNEIYPLADEAFRFLYLITGTRSNALQHLSAVYEKVYTSLEEAMEAKDLRVYLFQVCWQDACREISNRIEPDTADHGELSVFLANYNSSERLAMVGIDILGLSEADILSITHWDKNDLMQNLERGREKLQKHNIE